MPALSVNAPLSRKNEENGVGDDDRGGYKNHHEETRRHAQNPQDDQDLDNANYAGRKLKAGRQDGFVIPVLVEVTEISVQGLQLAFPAQDPLPEFREASGRFQKNSIKAPDRKHDQQGKAGHRDDQADDRRDHQAFGHVDEKGARQKAHGQEDGGGDEFDGFIKGTAGIPSLSGTSFLMR